MLLLAESLRSGVLAGAKAQFIRLAFFGTTEVGPVTRPSRLSFSATSKFAITLLDLAARLKPCPLTKPSPTSFSASYETVKPIHTSASQEQGRTQPSKVPDCSATSLRIFRKSSPSRTASAISRIDLRRCRLSRCMRRYASSSLTPRSR